ncbi:HTH lysR-type domain-containing protein [Candidatus Nitrotoga sp. BS]|uniref:LysR family transcriptional regulator n=1 Tax=Candidatus Nitrotoga sp. BS TaxID=2890408 RepID=UPI001EF3CD82|nr:LysR family transcriptional regulator [Candidatus Nitrotoga sp. BS]CAH1213110.1 HTH lysR-type domain-containing protein [Candidatus Nitrotoga sp. BS]
MDHLHLMQVYVAVAEEQGFASGARRLKMSPPSVTRAIATLEEKLGVKLLNRTTRYVRTTEAGRRYLEDARRIIREVELANEAAIGINAQPKGRLVITAPVLFGQKYVMPTIVEYLSTYPDTQVEAVFLDRVVNLLEEGFDLGVRIGHLPDSSMHAKTVGTVRLILVASPDYLAQRGIPQTPDDLLTHTLISSSAGNLAHDWHFEHQNKKHTVRIQPRLTTTTNQGAINAARIGLGITRVISYQVTQELEEGSLKAVLKNYEPPSLPVHIIHREGRMASSKVRCFIGLLAGRLKLDKNLN